MTPLIPGPLKRPAPYAKTARPIKVLTPPTEVVFPPPQEGDMAIDYDLFHMLSPRPSESPESRAWAKKWLLSIPGATMDEADNVILDVGTTGRTLFCSHYDTVHKSVDPIKLWVDKAGLLLARREGDNTPSILGADDTAGCWLMRKMALAGVPGTYIWHADEEIGCVGSRWINENTKFTGYERAISFDRRGTKDVITRMSPGITASDEFAKELCARLGMGYAPSAFGSITDSGQYRKQIPECTNISVGYKSEHTANERLDYIHLQSLLPILIALDWESLPVIRDHTVPDPAPKYFSGGYYGGSRWDDAEDDWWWGSKPSLPAPGFDTPAGLIQRAMEFDKELGTCYSYDSVRDLMSKTPMSSAAWVWHKLLQEFAVAWGLPLPEVAEILHEGGTTIDSLNHEVITGGDDSPSGDTGQVSTSSGSVDPGTEAADGQTSHG